MKTWSLFIFALTFGVCLQAQSLSHNITSDSLLLGNYFIYEIKLENLSLDVFNGDKIDFPELDQFEIVSGPNTNASVTMVNGDRSMHKTYSWYLKPSDLGQYFIEPISLKTDDGEIYETDPLEINVFPNPDGLKIDPRVRSRGNIFGLSPNTPTQGKKKAKPKRELKKG